MAASDTDDSLAPASTSFNVSNSGNVTFSGGTINGFPVTVTCTNVTLTAKTRASGLTADVTTNPNFNGSCTDNALGGTNSDTVTSSGTWTLTLVDNTSEPSTDPNPETAPNSGDKLTINIPANGVTFTSSAFSSCHVITGASTPTGSYDDQTTATFNNAAVNISGSGCTTSATTNLSGTFKTNTNIGDLTS
jgi:hypothetical protein